MSVRMSNAALATAGKSRSKYRNQRTSCGMHEHDSKREAIRCGELQLLEKAHQISGLRTQHRIGVDVQGHHICDYVADFIYQKNGQLVVEDVKSPATMTPVFRLKAKLLKATSGIDILITR